MQARRAVDADPDAEAVLGEEGAPGVVEQAAVRLQVVLTGPALREIPLLERQCLGVEGGPHECRLPTVPDEAHDRTGARSNERPHVGLENPVVHPVALARREQARLPEVVAVTAVEIAHRPDGLGHDDDRLDGVHRRFAWRPTGDIRHDGARQRPDRRDERAIVTSR